MSAEVMLRPGRATLADWRAIYRGAQLKLDPISRADVEAGAAGLGAILAREEPRGSTGSDDGPTVADLMNRSGEYLPASLVRLVVALKLASLAQGMSGARWELVRALEICLARDMLPAMPSQTDSDRIALAHIFGLLTGAGEAESGGVRRPASKVLKEAGYRPMALSPTERSALLSGTQLATAYALAGLFEAERVFQSGLVASAISAEASGGAPMPIHPRIHILHRHPGEIEVAAALRMLSGTAHGAGAQGGTRPAAPLVRRAQPRMGACLDLLRQAGETLQREANAVTEQRLVIWQSEEIVDSASDSTSVALAGDLIAIALREIGALSEQRIVLSNGRVDRADAGEDATATAPSSMAAAFVAENRERACSAGMPAISGDALSANGNGIRRLLPMAGTAALVVAIEILAAKVGDAEAADESIGVLDKVLRLIRETVPPSGGHGQVTAAGLASAADLVRSGAIAAAPDILLPSVLPVPPRTAFFVSACAPSASQAATRINSA